MQAFGGIEFVFVPGGPFRMGSTAEEQKAAAALCNQYYGDGDDCQASWYEDEGPSAEVAVDEFWIMQFEVTNVQFKGFVEGDGYSNQEYWSDTGWQWRDENAITEPEDWSSLGPNGDHPVVGISWYEAMAYARWLSLETGLEFRLPTEAEWEKAARGSDGRVFPWGNEWDPSRLNYCDANCDRDWKDKTSDDGYALTAPVGQFESGKSPNNAYDMAGNVWEWASTIYDQDEFPYPYQNDGRESLVGDSPSRVAWGRVVQQPVQRSRRLPR